MTKARPGVIERAYDESGSEENIPDSNESSDEND